MSELSPPANRAAEWLASKDIAIVRVSHDLSPPRAGVTGGQAAAAAAAAAGLPPKSPLALTPPESISAVRTTAAPKSPATPGAGDPRTPGGTARTPGSVRRRSTSKRKLAAKRGASVEISLPPAPVIGAAVFAVGAVALSVWATITQGGGRRQAGGGARGHAEWRQRR